MLIYPVHSDVLIISLLKTFLYYPGDTRNVNAFSCSQIWLRGDNEGFSLLSLACRVAMGRYCCGDVCIQFCRAAQEVRGGRKVSVISSVIILGETICFCFGLCFFIWIAHIWSRPVCVVPEVVLKHFP